MKSHELIAMTKVEMVKSSEDLPNHIIILRNVHKTYLLGIEGISALRGFHIKLNYK